MADNYVGHLEIHGAEGESEVEGFKKQIKVLSWGFSAHATSTVASSGGSSGPGRGHLSPLLIRAGMDKAAHKLLKYVLAGKHETSAELTIHRVGQSVKFATYKFNQVYIVAWNVEHFDPGDLPRLEFVFDYGLIEAEYFTQNEEGDASSAGTVTYDIRQNKLT